jgi:uncharacterized protein YheU (UPF0270 family)
MNQKTQTATQEEWVYISYDQVMPSMLRVLIEEFIAKERFFPPEFLLEKKVEKILERLKDGIFMIVYDLVSGTANIVVVH